MAKIWFVAGGVEPTRGGPWTEAPVAQCIKKLKLDLFCRTEDRPRFGDDQRGLFPTVVVVEIEDVEASDSELRPGFYQSPLTVPQTQTLFPRPVT